MKKIHNLSCSTRKGKEKKSEFEKSPSSNHVEKHVSSYFDIRFWYSKNNKIDIDSREKCIPISPYRTTLCLRRVTCADVLWFHDFTTNLWPTLKRWNKWRSNLMEIYVRNIRTSVSMVTSTFPAGFFPPVFFPTVFPARSFPRQSSPR